MKKVITAAILVASVISAPAALASGCGAGQGNAVDVNATTGAVTYSCVNLPAPVPAPIIPTPVATPAPVASPAPVISGGSSPVVDSTTATATIAPQPIILPAPAPAIQMNSISETVFQNILNQLMAIINSLMKKLGLL